MPNKDAADTPSSKEYDRSFDRGRDQRLQKERVGTEVEGEPTHPAERETGYKGASNVGQDETSGSD